MHLLIAAISSLFRNSEMPDIATTMPLNPHSRNIGHPTVLGIMLDCLMIISHELITTIQPVVRSKNLLRYVRCYSLMRRKSLLTVRVRQVLNRHQFHSNINSTRESMCGVDGLHAKPGLRQRVDHLWNRHRFHP